MADAAAKRELRRRRILENSESRLQRITGKLQEKSTEEKINNYVADSRSRSQNGFVNVENTYVTENKAILEKKYKDFLEQDINSDIQELDLTEPDVQYKNYFASNNSDFQYTLKEDRRKNDLNFNPKSSTLNQVTLEKHESTIFYNLFFSPLTNILLAIFVNILLLAKVNFSLYKGILTPYFLMAITRLCFQNKSQEFQGNSMLMAALILCNIKPEIVHILKKVTSFCSTTSKDFAIYLISFVLINWIISICQSRLTDLQFY